VAASIDAVVESLVDLVIALRIATLNHHAQFFMDIFERAPLGTGHSLGGKSGAERL